MNRLTVFPCHAPQDQSVVAELAAFLQPNLDLDWCAPEGCLQPSEDLIGRIDYALQGDVVLVLLSPGSSPARWARERWEPVLFGKSKEFGVKVAYLLLSDCRFPPLLRNQNFFDLTRDRLDGFRQIKRWLLHLRPPPQCIYFAPSPPDPFLDRPAELEWLRARLADQPGVVALLSAVPGAGKTALAAEFAHRYDDDFHGVLWIPCGRRSAARLAGELALQLGLRLEGDTLSNQEALQLFCSDRRCLIVLDDFQTDAGLPLIPAGRASVLITSERQDLPGERLVLDPLPGFQPGPPPTTTSELDAALSYLQDPVDWRRACSLARRAVRIAREQYRLAEADELLQSWFARAEQKGDRRVLEECAWERLWILEQWGREDEARRLDDYRRSTLQDQMTFDFTST